MSASNILGQVGPTIRIYFGARYLTSEIDMSGVPLAKNSWIRLYLVSLPK